MWTTENRHRYDRDEPRYAVCVREMRQRNDWIFPTYNAEPRYHNPILIYWLMRLGVAIGGDNPFGMRLVSGFAGAATCVLVWGLGRRMFGPPVGRLQPDLRSCHRALAHDEVCVVAGRLQPPAEPPRRRGPTLDAAVAGLDSRRPRHLPVHGTGSAR